MPTEKEPNPFNMRVAALPVALIAAEVALLDKIAEGEKPALGQGICGNMGNVALEWTDKEQIDSKELEDDIAGWVLHELSYWPSENYSGCRHYPVRCPTGMDAPTSDNTEIDREAARAKWMYFHANIRGTLYDQKTEYGRARAELARYLAGKMRGLTKVVSEILQPS